MLPDTSKKQLLQARNWNLYKIPILLRYEVTVGDENSKGKPKLHWGEVRQTGLCWDFIYEDMVYSKHTYHIPLEWEKYQF